MKCACGKIAIVEVEAQVSGARLRLCRWCVKKALKLKGLSEATRTRLEAALATN